MEKCYVEGKINHNEIYERKIKKRENFYHNKSFLWQKVAFYRCEAVNWNTFKKIYKSYWVEKGFVLIVLNRAL